MILKPPGIEDIFPDRVTLWNFVIDTAKRVFKLNNYKELIIPIMEYTEVFARGLGDETDIVSKEMFTFEDRGGRSLTLRPEGTASVVRAYVENGEYNRLSTCKFFYVGPMFRAERPQRGRLRQFNQFGAELFGSRDPYYDYEIISMVDRIAKELGIKEYKLLVNSIGCPECRKKYIEDLYSYYAGKEDILCEDCKKRLKKNTLRLLDCKNESCIKIRRDAPVISTYLCEDCKTHHRVLKEYLNIANINYIEDAYLVRGLDYYTKTTFEFVTADHQKSQSTFAAGGRYDRLVEEFGGKSTPAVGFAAGIERILLMIEGMDIQSKGIDAYLIHSGGETLQRAILLAHTLASASISIDIDPDTKGFKSQFKKADREKARFALVIGEDELASNTCTVKDLKTGEQEKVGFDMVVSYIETRLEKG